MKAAVTFFVIALLCSLIGFGVYVPGITSVARILFFVFAALSAVCFIKD